MPDHLKNAQNSPEFDQYLKKFVQRKERQHVGKLVQSAVAAFALMIAS